MPSASEQWFFNITWIRSSRFRDVLPVDRLMSFVSNVESPQEWTLLRIMRSFLPSCLRPPQVGGILKPPHVAMPTLSIPRTCNPLFPIAINSTFYEQASAGRAGTSVSCVDNADNVLKRISQLHRFHRIPIRIPKSCRIPVAEAIDQTITSASNTVWNNLVFFHYLAFGVPISPNTAGSSLSHPSSV